MRKKYVIGNWKMNLSLIEAKNLVIELMKIQITESATMVICPSFPYIHTLVELLDKTSLEVGAQNCAENEKGAFTGEVSSQMLSSIGATYIIVGHSERRALFLESDEVVRKKIEQGLKAGLNIIFCCGESLSERESGDYNKIIRNQLLAALKGLSVNQMSSIIIAYEPVWAIGTGKTASPEQAQEVHSMLRKEIEHLFGKECAESISILYGGSCNAQNAKELFGQADIDGGLIGGASLKSVEFEQIYHSF